VNVDAWIFGMAGAMRTTRQAGRIYRGAIVGCGACGRRFAGEVDAKRTQRHALECPHCGQHAGLELDEVGE